MTAAFNDRALRPQRATQSFLASEQNGDRLPFAKVSGKIPYSLLFDLSSFSRTPIQTGTVGRDLGAFTRESPAFLRSALRGMRLPQMPNLERPEAVIDQPCGEIKIAECETHRQDCLTML